MARWPHHNADGGPYSLRKVASELVGYGYTTPSGKPYSAAAVASMVQPSRTSGAGAELEDGQDVLHEVELLVVKSSRSGAWFVPRCLISAVATPAKHDGLRELLLQPNWLTGVRAIQ